MTEISSFDKRMRWALAAGLAAGGIALADRLFSIGLSDTLSGFLTGLAVGALTCWAVFKVLPRWWKEALCAERESKAGRQYMRRMWPAMAAYVVLLPVSMVAIKHGIPFVPLRAGVALLPVVPIALVLFAFIDYVRKADEFQRKVELESVGVAAFVVSIGYMSAGFLQLAHVIQLDAGAAMIWVFPVLSLGYAIGKFMALRRFQ